MNSIRPVEPTWGLAPTVVVVAGRAVVVVRATVVVVRGAVVVVFGAAAAVVVGAWTAGGGDVTTATGEVVVLVVVSDDTRCQIRCFEPVTAVAAAVAAPVAMCDPEEPHAEDGAGEHDPRRAAMPRAVMADALRG